MAVIYLPPPKHIFRVGIQNIMVMRHWLIGFHGEEEGVQNIMAAIYRTPPQTHFQGGDSEYYGCETLTYWFPWLGGGGSKYYGCDISNPPNTFSGWGFRILWLWDIDLWCMGEGGSIYRGHNILNPLLLTSWKPTGGQYFATSMFWIPKLMVYRGGGFNISRP